MCTGFKASSGFVAKAFLKQYSLYRYQLIHLTYKIKNINPSKSNKKRLDLLMILRTVDRGVTGLLLPLDVDAEVEGGGVPARPSQ